MTENLIIALVGWSLLGLLVYWTKHQRNKRASIRCPKCGKILRPHATGMRNRYYYIYKYKCSRCGYKAII